MLWCHGGRFTPLRETKPGRKTSRRCCGTPGPSTPRSMDRASCHCRVRWPRKRMRAWGLMCWAQPCMDSRVGPSKPTKSQGTCMAGRSPWRLTGNRFNGTAIAGQCHSVTECLGWNAWLCSLSRLGGCPTTGIRPLVGSLRLTWMWPFAIWEGLVGSRTCCNAGMSSWVVGKLLPCVVACFRESPRTHTTPMPGSRIFIETKP